ncbi:MAG TPA: hypothetical protein VNC50_01705 [Planctomycetia bacterium]|nr:hypothetical protein [Planctomycetia bacterium]
MNAFAAISGEFDPWWAGGLAAILGLAALQSAGAIFRKHRGDGAAERERHAAATGDAHHWMLVGLAATAPAYFLLLFVLGALGVGRGATWWIPVAAGLAAAVLGAAATAFAAGLAGRGPAALTEGLAESEGAALARAARWTGIAALVGAAAATLEATLTACLAAAYAPGTGGHAPEPAALALATFAHALLAGGAATGGALAAEFEPEDAAEVDGGAPPLFGSAIREQLAFRAAFFCGLWACLASGGGAGVRFGSLAAVALWLATCGLAATWVGVRWIRPEPARGPELRTAVARGADLGAAIFALLGGAGVLVLLKFESWPCAIAVAVGALLPWTVARIDELWKGPARTAPTRDAAELMFEACARACRRAAGPLAATLVILALLVFAAESTAAPGRTTLALAIAGFSAALVLQIGATASGAATAIKGAATYADFDPEAKLRLESLRAAADAIDSGDRSRRWCAYFISGLGLLAVAFPLMTDACTLEGATANGGAFWPTAGIGAAAALLWIAGWLRPLLSGAEGEAVASAGWRAWRASAGKLAAAALVPIAATAAGVAGLGFCAGAFATLAIAATLVGLVGERIDNTAKTLAGGAWGGEEGPMADAVRAAARTTAPLRSTAADALWVSAWAAAAIGFLAAVARHLWEL